MCASRLLVGPWLMGAFALVVAGGCTESFPQPVEVDLESTGDCRVVELLRIPFEQKSAHLEEGLACADGIYLRYSVNTSQHLIKLAPGPDSCAFEWDRPLYEPYGPHAIAMTSDGGLVVAAGRLSGDSRQPEQGWRVVEFAEVHPEYNAQAAWPFVAYEVSVPWGNPFPHFGTTVFRIARLDTHPPQLLESDAGTHISSASRAVASDDHALWVLLDRSRAPLQEFLPGPGGLASGRSFEVGPGGAHGVMSWKGTPLVVGSTCPHDGNESLWTHSIVVSTPEVAQSFRWRDHPFMIDFVVHQEDVYLLLQSASGRDDRTFLIRGIPGGSWKSSEIAGPHRGWARLVPAGERLFCVWQEEKVLVVDEVVTGSR
jgi:hypothetical protein